MVMREDGHGSTVPAAVANKTQASSRFLAEPGIHEAWKNAYLNPGLDGIYEAIFGRIHTRLTGHPEPRLLDAGCGYCYHSVRLARRGVHVTGIDFSPAALLAARDVIAEAGLTGRIDLQEGSLLALPFDDGAFDNVLCWGVLMHIPEIETALSELCRVVAPGGRLVIGENSWKSFDCRFLRPSLRLAKRLLDRRLPEQRRTPFGIEEWTEADSGGLMVRNTDLGVLADFCTARGLRHCSAAARSRAS